MKYDITFDDVLLVPKYSEVRSRKMKQFGGVIDLTSYLTPRYQMVSPIISANMDTVTEIEMMAAMYLYYGGCGIIHRFLPIEEQAQQIQNLPKRIQERLDIERIKGNDWLNNKTHIIKAAAIGTSGDFKERINALVDAGVEVLCIDIAHGHSIMMKETIAWCKQNFPHIDIIAGNVATAQGVFDLADWGADTIKVGIGPGAMCTTRLMTGFGIAQLTAITDCVTATKEFEKKTGRFIPIIADGGIRSSGDIVKALAAGASSVMVGSLLSGTKDTPGAVIRSRGQLFKSYRGMASKDAQISWSKDEDRHAEGESSLITYKGKVSKLLRDLLGGICSGLSYAGAITIKELQEKAEFRYVTGTVSHENKPHGFDLY